MKKVYLCGHTGSANRGCEAIVRSTAIILKACGVTDISLTTSAAQDDKRLGVDKVVKLLPLPQKSIFLKGASYIKRKFLKDSVWGAKKVYDKLFKDVEKDSIFFNIGGDTYCYKGIPSFSFALNDIAKEKCIPNVFWGFSIEDDLVSEKAYRDDLNKYSCLTPREKLSFDSIQKCIEDKSKIYKMCDPAFHLNITETQLPENFKENNTLGINVSFFVFGNDESPNSIMYKNLYNLIDFVFENTDMSVCLIPHVYNVENQTHDCMPLGEIFRHYKGNDRISYINKELSCTELKYIISKCRFFIGARTHSTIAAYSTGVPCIALSYSVKSIGIANDLFGTHEGYALSYKNIKKEDEIKNAFVSLMNNEAEIRLRYEKVLPTYKETAITATKEILNRLNK